MTKFMKLFALIFTVYGIIFVPVGIRNFFINQGKDLPDYYVIDWIIPIVAGGAMFLIGFPILLRIHKKERLKKILLSTGRVIYAQIQSVNVNYRVRYNGKYPYNITCSWHDPSTNLTYFFTSDDLQFDPSQRLEEQGIQEIPVYIDPQNIKRYYVNTDMIE